MYAGHFATAFLFHSYFPEVNPFLFTFGVGILDIVFGILAYFHMEGLSINPKAGLLGLDLHCPFTHSLVGSLTISLLWGSLSLDVRSFLPVFASAFSHFIEDWFVHNRDLELYPGSSVFVGGLRLWSRYPYGFLLSRISALYGLFNWNVETEDDCIDVRYTKYPLMPSCLLCVVFTLSTTPSSQ